MRARCRAACAAGRAPAAASATAPRAQVEGLCALVSGVEDLVGAAERECGRMQARPRMQRRHRIMQARRPGWLAACARSGRETAARRRLGRRRQRAAARTPGGLAVLGACADSGVPWQERCAPLQAASVQAHARAPHAQAEYHHQKFATFEHVESPARLIRELVRPRRAPAAASPAGAPEAALTPP